MSNLTLVAVMAGALEFSRTLADLIRARFPIIYVSTAEEERVLRHVRSIGRYRAATSA